MPRYYSCAYQLIVKKWRKYFGEFYRQKIKKCRMEPGNEFLIPSVKSGTLHHISLVYSDIQLICLRNQTIFNGQLAVSHGG